MIFDQRVDQISSAARTVLIGFNSKAGSNSSNSPINQLSKALSSRGLTVQLETDIQRIADEAVRLQEAGSLRAVVAAGGDGTVSLFANRLLAEIPLAVFPTGTENLLAKHLGISADPVPLAVSIAAGHCVHWMRDWPTERSFWCWRVVGSTPKSFANCITNGVEI